MNPDFFNSPDLEFSMVFRLQLFHFPLFHFPLFPFSYFPLKIWLLAYLRCVPNWKLKPLTGLSQALYGPCTYMGRFGIYYMLTWIMKTFKLYFLASQRQSKFRSSFRNLDDGHVQLDGSEYWEQLNLMLTHSACSY